MLKASVVGSGRGSSSVPGFGWVEASVGTVWLLGLVERKCGRPLDMSSNKESQGKSSGSVAKEEEFWLSMLNCSGSR